MIISIQTDRVTMNIGLVIDRIADKIEELIKLVILYILRM